MPLQKLLFKPGVSSETTSYANEGGWVRCNRIRFRAGLPEKIGGWQRLSANTYQGVTHSIANWRTLAGSNLLGFGTNLKYYIEEGGVYRDITPIRRTVTLGADPIAATSGSNVAIVSDSAHGAVTGDFVTLSGATSFAGISAALLNREFQVTVLTANTYSVVLPAPATSTASGGGAAVGAAYQVGTGPAFYSAASGWGTGAWSREGWGSPGTGAGGRQLRLWSQDMFGEDLLFNPRGGALYYWDATSGTSARGVAVSSLPGAADVPMQANFVLVSDIYRIAMAFGTTPVGGGTLDPMLVRWSDQEDITDWAPTDLNQAGDQLLSYGTQIVTALNTRQEILVWTDSALYSAQYINLPLVFSFTLLDQNLSIASPNAACVADNTTYWMGTEKFFAYSGRVNTLDCSLLRAVFDDINTAQLAQVVAGTNEQWNEIWWFYPSAGSLENDRYVVYNYVERVWYNGELRRSAWLDSKIRQYPMGAVDGKIVYHEKGLDDAETAEPRPLGEYIESSDFDIEDGTHFSFISRILPDVTFSNSVNPTPTVQLELRVRNTTGALFKPPGGGAVERVVSVPVEQFTEQLWIRLRGRQMSLKVAGIDRTGVHWQLGAPRIDVRKDGRR